MIRRLLSSRAFPPLPSALRFAPTIRQLLENPGEVNDARQVTVSGWIKSIRRQKNVSFAVVTDGSSAQGLQAVFVGGGKDSAEVKILTNGAAVKLTGKLVTSPGKGQDRELIVELEDSTSVSVSQPPPGRVELLGECPHETYPIQKQSLSNEYLRDRTHLRARTDKIAAMIRLRSMLQRRINTWFENQGFQHINTPILTGSDAEGAGEAFRIAPIQGEHPAAIAARQDSSSPSLLPPPTDFFSRPAYLTVSHQLHLEALAAALSRVYTLSPCFRAEPSLTGRHLAEFWMLEAEWAFSVFEPGSPSPMVAEKVSDTKELCQVVEAMLRSVASGVVGPERTEDVSLLWKQNNEDKLISLEKAMKSETPWTRMNYANAIKELQNHHWTYRLSSGDSSGNSKFQYEPKYGKGLQSEHERWLAEHLVGGPVFVTDYPSTLKPFYMRSNSRQGVDLSTEEAETVACFDLLVPHVGELVGGSVREERLDALSARMDQAGMGGPDYEWYKDLRRYGGAPHGGFGMGFERLVSWVGGIENVREAVPVPRWAGRMLL
ncbi:hypothetical protein AX15_005110 [Amanita polypyramis BW_CC]|nr:hypothetical protein AX15_005110 [Amanita polypyramis BW_CC]